MGVANKTYSKAKEELEQMQNLNADIEDEKQSYAENIHEAKHKAVILLALKNCKVKSVKYMGKLLSY
mgnify:CR=1 FL=1